MRLSFRRRPSEVASAVTPESAWRDVMRVPYEGALIEFYASRVRFPEVPLRGRFAASSTTGGPRWWINLTDVPSDLGPASIATSRIVRWRYL